MNCIHFTSIRLHFNRCDRNSQNDQLPVGLIAQLVEMVHRYHRGHVFESLSTLKFKRLSYFSYVGYTTSMVIHFSILSFSAQLVYDFHSHGSLLPSSHQCIIFEFRFHCPPNFENGND